MRSSILAALLLVSTQRAGAFSQEGHMVTGAIVYEELHDHDAQAVAQIVQLMSQHPDRGSFEISLGRVSGEERARRLFMEMARWPDDIRHGEYDHPTWHYSSKPLIDAQRPPARVPLPATAGSAAEAWSLALSIVRDARAPGSERAIALCWLFHLAGDIHQPLHAADGYSTEYPDGDAGGNLRYVIDPETLKPLSLHWYWDQAADRSGAAASARAGELRAEFPRAGFSQLSRRTEQAGDFAGWAAESYLLARSEVYRPDLRSGASEKLATGLPATYAVNTALVASRQLTLSGYRLTDLLRMLFPA